MGEPSRSRSKDPARDVLAAEAFAVPAPDPALRQEPVRLPEDPSGIPVAHDILAAEEFAMPAPRPGSRPVGPRAALMAGAQSPWRAAFAAAGAALGALVLRRRRGA